MLPPDFHSITPYLIVKDGAAAIEFYQRAFGATEMMRMMMPDGKLGYGEIKIGDSLVLLSDEYPEMGALSPTTLGGTAVRVHLYVPNVDTLCQQAISQGAKIIRELQDQFFGDRSGALEDPFGHIWSIATRKENLTREEMLNRFANMMQK